jgi:hypothetical protein
MNATRLSLDYGFRFIPEISNAVFSVRYDLAKREAAFA